MSGGIATHIQDLGIRWGASGLSRRSCFTPGQGAPGTNLNEGGGRGGLTGGLDALEQFELRKRLGVQISERHRVVLL